MSARTLAPEYLSQPLCDQCAGVRATWLDEAGALKAMPPRSQMTLEEMRWLYRTGQLTAFRDLPADSVQWVTERCLREHQGAAS